MLGRVNRFEKLNRMAIIKGVIRTKTLLHVGMGKSWDPLDSDMPVVKSIDRKPYIPGSSFRGVLRSLTESILRALCGEEKGACMGIENSDKWCVKDENNLEKLCIACRIFGNTVVASKVRVLDLYLANPDSWDDSLYIVKDGISIDREKGTVADKAKFDYEAVPPGVDFKLEMIVENPDDGELGVLLMSLDLMSKGLGAIGGKKGAGLGHFEIVDFEMIVYDRAEELLKDAPSKRFSSLEEALKSYRAETEKLLSS